ncbi:hypothetical protein J7M07_09450 [bacterium]|nr:hypothetical protein [bacterium]
MNKPVFLMAPAFCLLIFSVAFGMYNPRTGRFLQQDSLGTKPEVVFTGGGPRIIGTKGPYVPNPNDPMSSLNQYIDGMNLYEYVKSNPIMLIDPTGGCSTGIDHANDIREIVRDSEDATDCIRSCAKKFYTDEFCDEGIEDGAGNMAAYLLCQGACVDHFLSDVPIPDLDLRN